MTGLTDNVWFSECLYIWTHTLPIIKKRYQKIKSNVNKDWGRLLWGGDRFINEYMLYSQSKWFVKFSLPSFSEFSVPLWFVIIHNSNRLAIGASIQAISWGILPGFLYLNARALYVGYNRRQGVSEAVARNERQHLDSKILVCKRDCRPNAKAPTGLWRRSPWGNQEGGEE